MVSLSGNPLIARGHELIILSRLQAVVGAARFTTPKQSGRYYLTTARHTYRLGEPLLPGESDFENEHP